MTTALAIEPQSTAKKLLDLFAPFSAPLVEMHCRYTSFFETINGSGEILSGPFILDLLYRIQICFEGEYDGPRLWQTMQGLSFASQKGLPLSYKQ